MPKTDNRVPVYIRLEPDVAALVEKAYWQDAPRRQLNKNAWYARIIEREAQRILKVKA